LDSYSPPPYPHRHPPTMHYFMIPPPLLVPALSSHSSSATFLQTVHPSHPRSFLSPRAHPHRFPPAVRAGPLPPPDPHPPRLPLGRGFQRPLRASPPPDVGLERGWGGFGGRAWGLAWASGVGNRTRIRGATVDRGTPACRPECCRCAQPISPAVGDIGDMRGRGEGGSDWEGEVGRDQVGQASCGEGRAGLWRGRLSLSLSPFLLFSSSLFPHPTRKSRYFYCFVQGWTIRNVVG
jgi:hypothetical protein